MKKSFVIIVLCLLVCSSFKFILAEKSDNTIIYVDDDNTDGPWNGTKDNPFRYIQDAIDNASNGDSIFVNEGIYNENIIINKSIFLIGEEKNTTIINGYSEYHTSITIVENNTEISGFSIYQGKNGFGIRIESMMNKIYNNKLTNNECGIWIKSNNNTITDNQINNCVTGIMNFQSYNNISNNIIDKTRYGIDNRGEFNIISNNNILNSIQRGIILYGSSKNTIYLNNINLLYDFGIGIGLAENSNDNLVYKNSIITEISYCGIWLIIDSDNNTITSNNVSGNNIGIIISQCNKKQNKIVFNNIYNNTIGVSLERAKNNLVEHNNIYNNSKGIELKKQYKDTDTSKNTISHNNLIGNKLGLNIIESSLNIIKKNNFMMNNNSVHYSYSDNTWFKNYWERPRILPYVIEGSNYKYKFECDWFPALLKNKV